MLLCLCLLLEDKQRFKCGGVWWVNKVVFLICYLSLFYLDLIKFYLNIISFLNYFTSIANYYISGTNILKNESWSKRKGFWANSGWKYEDSIQKYVTPQVRDMARPVPPAARLCHPSDASFAAFCFPDKLPISLLLTQKPMDSCGAFMLYCLGFKSL